MSTAPNDERVGAVFMMTEWHPKDSISEYDVCSVCGRPTRDVVFFFTDETMVGMCGGCLANCLTLYSQTMDHWRDLDRMYDEP